MKGRLLITMINVGKHITTDTKFCLKKYLKSTDHICIIISASYDWSFKKSVCEIIMFYKNKYKKRSIIFDNVNSPNHASVLAAQYALNQCTASNSNIDIITYIPLGFGKVIKGKNCRYAKELFSLLQDASEKNNTIHSLTIIGGASIIKGLF